MNSVDRGNEDSNAQRSQPADAESQLRERVLVQLMKGHPSLAQLAESLKMTLDDLAAWSTVSANWRTLAALARFSDLQTHLLLGRFRISAGYHLLTMGSAKEATELARKACADLLDVRLDPWAAHDGSTRSMSSRTPRTGSAGWPPGFLPSVSEPTEREILLALEELGRDPLLQSLYEPLPPAGESAVDAEAVTTSESSRSPTSADNPAKAHKHTAEPIIQSPSTVPTQAAPNNQI